MKNSLNPTQLKEMFLYVAENVVASEEILTVIDKRIGDGDHGTGMALGFKEVLKTLKDKSFENINEVFHSLGMTLIDTMGGASGVLFGTVFISGIVDVASMKEIDLKGFYDIFYKSLNALKKRGKANVGDKTMVDAFEPAVMGLKEAYETNLSLVKGLELAKDKAFEGVEYTKQCVAKFGRAKSYREQSIGFEDAGAMSVYIIFRSMYEWIKNNNSL